MEKKDFHKGQTVWIYLVGNAASGIKTLEERIQEWEVVSVGRKYITCRDKNCSWREAKFDIDNDFRHVYKYGTADYILHLSKEDISNKIHKNTLISNILDTVMYSKSKIRKMSVEDLEVINEILSKYEEALK